MKKLVVFARMMVLVGALGASALSSVSAPSFAPARSYATGRSPDSGAIGDLNGDGKDLATANCEASTVSILRRGDGSFSAKVDSGVGRGPASIAIVDLNGDHPGTVMPAGGRVNLVVSRGKRHS